MGSLKNNPRPEVPVFCEHQGSLGIHKFRGVLFKEVKELDELKLGKISNKDLISWLDTTPTQMQKKKKDLLKKLEDYCEFEPCYGGIIVTKIYKPCYSANPDLAIVREEFNEVWDKSGLDSCSRVSEEIYEKRYEDLKNKQTTIYNKTIQVRNEFYGKPMCGIGSKGVCKYIWCKKNKDTGRLEYLSEEEEKIKKELMISYFATTDEKTIMVQEMINRNELTEEEAWSYYSKITNLSHNYMAFMAEFKRITGITLIRGTEIEDMLVFKEQEFDM